MKKRRSIREFEKSQSLNDEIIKNAILTAGSAPNGANLQPWHFAIVKDNKIKKTNSYKLLKKKKNNFYNYNSIKVSGLNAIKTTWYR